MEGVVEQQAAEIHVLREYEQQMSSMSHALSKMEGAIRQEQEEKVRYREWRCDIFSLVLFRERW